jgi:hypothetical protein
VGFLTGMFPVLLMDCSKEIVVVIEDSDTIQSTMDGQPVRTPTYWCLCLTNPTLV